MSACPTLTTRRLTLRVGCPDDAADLAKAIGDWDIVSELAHGPWPYREADAGHFIANMQETELPRYLVFEKFDGRETLVGGCGATNGWECPKVGYWVRKSHWSRGIATEAVTALLAQLQDEGIKRVFAEHKAENHASAKVLQKLGFDVLTDDTIGVKIPNKSDPSLILRVRTL